MDELVKVLKEIRDILRASLEVAQATCTHMEELLQHVEEIKEGR